MAPLQNPLLSAGEFLVSETERLENVHPFDELFNGPKEQVEKRWAGSAVLDSAGGWHIVCMSSHIVESGGTRRIRLYSGGVLGRSQPRSAVAPLPLGKFVFPFFMVRCCASFPS